MKFNEKLIKMRKEIGLSQEELGNKLNVARQTVSKWELGETTPEMDKLIKISEVFNITLDELIKDEKVNEKTNNTNFQQLAGMVIKILKGLGIFLIILFVIILFLIIGGLISFNKIKVDSGTNVTVVEIQENNEIQFEE